METETEKLNADTFTKEIFTKPDTETQRYRGKRKQETKKDTGKDTSMVKHS